MGKTLNFIEYMQTTSLARSGKGLLVRRSRSRTKELITWVHSSGCLCLRPIPGREKRASHLLTSPHSHPRSRAPSMLSNTDRHDGWLWSLASLSWKTAAWRPGMVSISVLWAFAWNALTETKVFGPDLGVDNWATSGGHGLEWPKPMQVLCWPSHSRKTANS